MQEALSSLQDRLAPAEEIFFTWLMRVIAAATLVGCAWIDDAPPLDIAATIIGVYVAIRVVTQFGSLMTAAPVEHRVLKAFFAVFSIALLGLSFMAMITFVEYLALSVAG